MHRTACYLAVAACLAVSGSIAHAAPAKTKRTAVRKSAPPVHEHAEDGDDGVLDSSGHRIAFATLDTGDDAELVDAPVRLHRPAFVVEHDWQVAIGPDAWLSSVDATVSAGGKSVSAGTSFLTLEHHVRYGVPLLAEVRHGRFSLVTDLTYGVIDLSGGGEVGPVMVGLAGSASSLMVDSIAGVRVLGGEQSLLALEARAGVRYQRTAVAAAIGVGGTGGESYDVTDDGLDVVGGARVFVRPSSRISAAASLDVGVAGSSSRTWSAAADANVRITSHLLLSLGYRTLTMDRSYLNLVMHGPRAAIQMTF